MIVGPVSELFLLKVCEYSACPIIQQNHSTWCLSLDVPQGLQQCSPRSRRPCTLRRCPASAAPSIPSRCAVLKRGAETVAWVTEKRVNGLRRDAQRKVRCPDHRGRCKTEHVSRRRCKFTTHTHKLFDVATSLFNNGYVSACTDVSVFVYFREMLVFYHISYLAYMDSNVSRKVEVRVPFPPNQWRLEHLE